MDRTKSAVARRHPYLPRLHHALLHRRRDRVPVVGQHWLASSVAGHGWGQLWLGSIDGINDTGTLVDADGTERRIYWRPTTEDP